MNHKINERRNAKREIKMKTAVEWLQLFVIGSFFAFVVAGWSLGF